MVRWESELIPTISNSKALLGDLEDVAYEITSGYGIADVIFYSLNLQTHRNEALDALPLPIKTNVLRALLDLKSISGDKLLSIATLKKQSAFIKKDILTYLVEAGYLVEEKTTAEERYRIGMRYENGLKESIAIEAKIRDWKRGLYQAYRYKRYADQSYLAIYSKYIGSPLANKEIFRQHNVGLIEVMDDGIKVHFKPRKKNQQDEFLRAIAYENLLAYRLDSRPVIQKRPNAIPI